METPLAERIAADPNYQALKSRRSSFGWSLTIAMLIVYYGFILLVAMIGAIVLTHRSRGDVRGQDVSRQIRRRPQDATRNTNPPVGEGMSL